MKQTCGNCIHAEWQTTISGRRKTRTSGVCTVSVIIPPLPKCIRPVELHRYGIWTNDDATKCQLWSNVKRVSLNTLMKSYLEERIDEEKEKI